MEKRKFQIKKIHVIRLVILLAVYTIFIATRYSGHTTYVPFTGRVFNINCEELEAVRFQSGNTGQYIYFRSDDEIKEVTDFLNAFRYRVWVPSLPPIAGWGYRVTLFFYDGTSVSYFFNSFSICVNGVWHYGNLSYFREFTDALNALPLMG